MVLWDDRLSVLLAVARCLELLSWVVTLSLLGLGPLWVTAATVGVLLVSLVRTTCSCSPRCW